MNLRVRQLIAWFVMVAGLSCSAIHAQEAASPTGVEVVPRVQKNVAALRDLLPDFICDERVTRQDIEQGKTTREDHFISSFRVKRRMSPGSSTTPMFIETREVKSATVKGKPATVRNLVLPIGVTGGFCDDLFYFFEKEKGECFDFELAGSEKIRGRNALVLTIRVKSNAKPVVGKCPSFPPEKTSKAWVDSESMQIVRLQLFPTGLLEFAGPLSRWTGKYVINQSIDYAEVLINGTPYWLPTAKRAEFVKLKGQRSNQYVVEYSNFHKFDVSAKVLPTDYKQKE